MDERLVILQKKPIKTLLLEVSIWISLLFNEVLDLSWAQKTVECVFEN